jgi:hypothetical protein
MYARDALDQAEDGALATGANDRVGFPIANANALLDDGWSLIDVDAAGDNAASRDSATAFVVVFASAAQLPKRRAASVLVGPDVLIDTLLADVDLVRGAAPISTGHLAQP